MKIAPITRADQSQSPRRLWGIILVGGALVAIVAAARMGEGTERVPWRDDYAAAQQESRLSGKPMLLDFTATWCEPCQSMRHTTWADAGVVRLLDGYVPVYVDVDAHPDLARQFGADAIPLLVVVLPNGSVANRSVGAMGTGQFNAWLKGGRSARAPG